MIRERQQLVKELRGSWTCIATWRLSARNCGALVPERVLEWGESEARLPVGLRPLVALLAIATGAAAIYYGTTAMYWPLLSVCL